MNKNYKKSRLEVSIIAFIGYMLLTSNLAYARDYPMVCRVGGDMRLILTPNASTGDTRFELRFKKAGRGYNFDRTNIAPGECAWMERRLNNNEPTLMAWDLDARAFTSYQIRGSGHAFSRVISDGGSNVRTADFFLKAINGHSIENHRISYHDFFVVNVHNTNRGYFEIVSIQPGV